MTHSLVTRFCTCEALKTPTLQEKKKKIGDTPSSATLPNMTWACGAAKFSLEQVSDEGRRRGQVVTICAPKLLQPSDDATTAAAQLKCYFRHLV